MKILYFGAYNPLDQRNAVIINGLRENNVEIVECRDDSPGLKKFIKLFFKHWALKKDYDLIFVGFLSHILMPLAYLINNPLIFWRERKPLVLDGFMSLYDSNVFGRRKYGSHSFMGYYYWLLDWSAFHLADLVLFDTNEHIKYISKEFGLSADRMARSYAGAKESIFRPLPYARDNSKFIVLFHGTFIPSQGIEHILRAAKQLEAYGDVEFQIIGDGQTRREMIEMKKVLNINNVNFLGRMPQDELVKYIARADVCLGLFGKEDKIQRVIATKVFECAAMKKPIITGEASAVRELFDDGDIRFVKIADADDLARAIVDLRDNPDLRNKMANNAYDIFKKQASSSSIGAELKRLFSDLLKTY
jgi:glycosyltransferase involved in cell wall biosynthesis